MRHVTDVIFRPSLKRRIFCFFQRLRFARVETWSKFQCLKQRVFTDPTLADSGSQFLCEPSLVLRPCKTIEGFFRSEGGTVEAARLPKGWTGPVSQSGTQGSRKTPLCFFTRWSAAISAIRARISFRTKDAGKGFFTEKRTAPLLVS